MKNLSALFILFTVTLSAQSFAGSALSLEPREDRPRYTYTPPKDANETKDSQQIVNLRESFDRDGMVVVCSTAFLTINRDQAVEKIFSGRIGLRSIDHGNGCVTVSK